MGGRGVFSCSPPTLFSATPANIRPKAAGSDDDVPFLFQPQPNALDGLPVRECWWWQRQDRLMLVTIGNFGGRHDFRGGILPGGVVGKPGGAVVRGLSSLWIET